MICGTVEEMQTAEKELLISDLVGQIAMHRTEYPARIKYSLPLTTWLLERRGTP